ncbi:glycosyltransferase family 4 protein [Pirellulaceae bacterium SH449]
MKIVFFSHYFPPEGNAPASRTYDHCVRWVQAGCRVTVITCVPNVPHGLVYSGYRNRFWPQRESIDGIEVIRVWTYVAPNAGAIKRIANYLSYMFSSVMAFLFLCRRPDVIIATSPQFFCGWAGVFASWLKWSKLIVEIRDIWPDSIVTVGAMNKGMATRFLEWTEKALYRNANHIVTVGNGYRDNIVSKVPCENHISVITNGVDPKTFYPRPKSQEFLERWGGQNTFICAYVGTIGMAHGLEVVLDAARELKNRGRTDILFLLVGDGARRKELEHLADALDVRSHVRFTGLLSKESIPEVLASCDCLLVHLKKSELFETVIPSKIFETMAMARPLIMGVRGESAEIVRKSGCGIEIEPGNAQELVCTVTSLCDDPSLYSTVASSGREFVVREYSRDRFANDFLSVIEQVCKS